MEIKDISACNSIMDSDRGLETCVGSFFFSFFFFLKRLSSPTFYHRKASSILLLSLRFKQKNVIVRTILILRNFIFLLYINIRKNHFRKIISSSIVVTRWCFLFSSLNPKNTILIILFLEA